MRAVSQGGKKTTKPKIYSRAKTLDPLTESKPSSFQTIRGIFALVRTVSN